jgi:hypothetical protein
VYSYSAGALHHIWGIFFSTESKRTTKIMWKTL